MQRREHEVAGFRREQRISRLEVAHLADQDDVGVLAERAAQRVRERQRVDRDLALVDHRPVVAVQELDRVLDRHDVRRAGALMWSIIAASVVLLPLPVVPVTSTRPRSSSAIFFSTSGRPSSSIVRILRRDDAEDQADGATLLEHVAAEAAEAGNAVGEVDLLIILELLPLDRRHERPPPWRRCLRDPAARSPGGASSPRSASSG